MFNFSLYATRNVHAAYMPQAYRIQEILERALQRGNRGDFVDYIDDLHVISNRTHCDEISRMARAAAVILHCHNTITLAATIRGVGLA